MFNRNKNKQNKYITAVVFNMTPYSLIEVWRSFREKMVQSYNLTWGKFLRNVSTLVRDYKSSYPIGRLIITSAVSASNRKTKWYDEAIGENALWPLNRLSRKGNKSATKKKHGINQTTVAGLFHRNHAFVFRTVHVDSSCKWYRNLNKKCFGLPWQLSSSQYCIFIFHLGDGQSLQYY
jgi:hypothetical protein